MAEVGVVGSRGLLGSHILHNLLGMHEIKHVTCMGRNNPHTEHEKLKVWISKDLMAAYPKYIHRNNPAPDILFCAISISSGEVGGSANQRIIEYEAVIKIAKAAQQAGTKVFVLASISHFPYGRNFKFLNMKKELEKAIESIGFQRVVIVRMPLVFGLRDEGSTISGQILHAVGSIQGALSGPSIHSAWQRKACQVARASINAGLDALNVQGAPPVSVLRSNDIPKVAKSRGGHTTGAGAYPPVTRIRTCSI